MSRAEPYGADDSRFVASPSGTVHERREWKGDAHDYEYHPECGQRLPPESEWASVDADSAEEAVMRFDLSPCSKCIDDAYRLERWRKAVHSPVVMDHVDVPDRWETLADL